MNMTDGRLFGKIAAVALPLALSGILQLVFNAADLVVIGKFSDTGTVSLAAVSSNSALIGLIINVAIGLSLGANVALGQAIGRRDAEGAHRALHTAMLLSLVCGLVTAFIGCTCARLFLQWMQTDAAVIDKATTYLRIYFAGAPAYIVYNFGVSVLRAKGDTHRPLFYLALAGVVNVGLNLILVIFAKMDVAGVALATVLSQYLSCALTVIALLREKGYCRLVLKSLRFYRRELLQIIKVGLPSGILSSFFSIANVLIQSNVNTYGAQLIAGSATANTLESFIIVSMNSVGNASVTFAGQNFGARNFARIQRSVGISVLFEFLVCITGAVLFLSCGRFFLGLYTNDPMVVAYAYNRLWVTLPIYFVCGTAEVFAGGMRGMGHAVKPMMSNLFCICVFRVVWVNTICQAFHIPELLYLSWPYSWLINVVSSGVLYGITLLHERTKEYAIEPPDLD
jgi:putative MATE family efflux protein